MKNKKKMEKNKNLTFDKKLCYVPFAPPYYLIFFKVMSHLRHRRFYKIPPRGPIFIDGSIVTKVCYSISPLGKQNLY